MPVKQETRRSKTVWVLYNDSESRVLGIYPTEYRARKADEERKQKLAVVEAKNDTKRENKE